MIYDCFSFFNELDILEIRLNILNDTVDKFVLVEATRTHQGKLKSLYFEENKTRYQKFLNKITHVIIDEYPPYEGHTAWLLENYQRNMILKGLEGCKASDIILISDVDEIPMPEKIKGYQNKRGIMIFRQKMYSYYLNCMNNTKNYKWNGTIMLHFQDLKIPQALRHLSMRLSGIFHVKLTHRIYWILWKYYSSIVIGQHIRFINNAGWHYSYLGGNEMIINKLESFAHPEYNKEKFKDPQNIEQAIAEGKDILGRKYSYKFINIDETFPQYIRTNQDKYPKLIKKKLL